jgi:methionine-rich copper-binding protein CopC
MIGKEAKPMHRITTLAATAAAAFAVGAAPAAAHTEVKSTSPPAGSTKGTGLRAVTVTFTQAIQRGTLRVTKRGGRTASKGTGGRDPRKISRLKVRMKRGLAAGRYTARWTIKAVDGHEQSGSFSFRLKRR